MKYTLSIVCLYVLVFITTPQGIAQNSCIECHSEQDDNLKLPVDQMQQDDVHFQNNISCVDCHGGVADEEDMEEAMNPKKGYIGKPKRSHIPKLCAKCHSNAAYMRAYNPTLPTGQYQQYQSSQHGKLLKKGDSNVAVCTDCHGVHTIQPANITTSRIYPPNVANTCGNCHNNKTYMQRYKIPTDQLDAYKSSVHGSAMYEKGDRSAPTCNDCHGNHGAYPPGIASISHVCGLCHVTQAEMFSQSPHKMAFAEMDMPQCESCHGNHGIQHTHIDMLGVGEDSFCANCHDEESAGYKVASQMKQIEDSLVVKIELADSLLGKAGKAGVEVIEGEFTLKESKDTFIKARNSIHFFSLSKFKKVIQPGIKTADIAIKEGKNGLNEVQNRRKWLAFISVIIFLSAVTLFLKLKSMKGNDV